MRSPVPSRTLACLLALVLAGALVACNDEALDQLGAPGAHEVTLEVQMGDYWLAPASGEPVAPGGELARLPAHSDVTFHVRNVGSVAHALVIYSEDASDILVAAPRLAPGTEAEVRFHFHDEMTVLMRDEEYPDEMRALVVVLEED